MTDYVLLKLSSMITDYGEEILGRMFADYESVYKSSVDDFLSKNSIPMEKRGECRTYIAINPNDSKIIGFFSIGVRCLQIPDGCGLSKTMLRKLNRSEDNVAQAYLLGQLSRAEGYKGFGRILIDEALKKIKEAYEIVGCRLVRIDCTDRLIGYYEEHGFHYVKKNADKDLKQMLMIID